MTNETIRLTSLAGAAGCASKLGQAMLRDILRGLPRMSDPRLLVGSATGDDAGVYQLSKNLALVQTIDFFTPVVDDPTDYGQIAAANAISDVFAMGGRPITAMAAVGVPIDKLPPAVVRKILRGGASKAKEANVSLLGGHTIKTPEPIYGLAVTGTVHPNRVMTNANARPGDLLVLTKPIGTGIVTTALKRGLAPPAIVRGAVASMKRLNSVGLPLAERGLVRAATDITGFGLLGHLGSMCRASAVAMEIAAENVPTFGPQLLQLIEQDCVPGGTRANLALADESADWDDAVTPARRILLADAQTSGGLLLCVAPKKWAAVRDVLREHRTLAAAVIGRVVKNRPRISVRRQLHR